MFFGDRLRDVLSTHGNSSGYTHLLGGSKKIFDNRCDLFLGSNSLEKRNRTGADQSNNSGNNLYLEGLRHARCTSGIDFHKLESAHLVPSKFFQSCQKLLGLQ